MARYKTRDPMATTRDPLPESVTMVRKPRRYIPASTPTLCPDCGHNTRMDGGRHVDPVRKTILEYRTCVNGKCRAPLAAGRPMTAREVDKYCTHVEAVAEYQGAQLLSESRDCPR